MDFKLKNKVGRKPKPITLGAFFESKYADLFDAEFSIKLPEELAPRYIHAFSEADMKFVESIKDRVVKNVNVGLMKEESEDFGFIGEIEVKVYVGLVINLDWSDKDRERMNSFEEQMKNEG